MARTQKKPKPGLARRLMQVRGATPRAEFAKELDVAERTLGSYERGESMPSTPFLNAIRKIRGIDLNWLITGGSGSQDTPIEKDAYADVIARLQQRLDETGLEPERASVQAGYPKDHLPRVLSGEFEEFRSDWIKSIAAVLKCNRNWLMTGEGRFDAPDTDVLRDDVVWRAVKEIAGRPGVTTLDPSGLADLVVNVALHIQYRETEDLGNIVEFGTDSLRRKKP